MECTVDLVDDVLPEQVTETIDTVLECAEELDVCVAAATTPAKLAACGEANAECVAGALNVTLPEIPAEEVVTCATEATECTLEAETVSSIVSCGEELLACAQRLRRPGSPRESRPQHGNLLQIRCSHTIDFARSARFPGPRPHRPDV